MFYERKKGMAENAENRGYKGLLTNTFIFAIGSFSSKVLSLILVTVYTNILTKAQLGLTDNFVNVANWLIPMVTLTVSEAVVRFGLDKSYDKKRIFTIGSNVVLIGILCLACVMFFLYDNSVVKKYIGSYSWLLFLYVSIGGYKLMCDAFVRSLEKIKLVAASGILGTFVTLVCSVLFMVVLKMGVVGYLASIVISDVVAIIFLMLTAKLYKYYTRLSIGRNEPFNKGLTPAMLRYCVPLIPTQLLWLITNTSDSFMITHYLGLDKTGILSAAYKIPNLLTIIYMMFGNAWNISAITESGSDERERFYSNVFDINQSLLYITAAGILMIIRPLTAVWIGKEFRSSVLYSPGLVFSTVFICFTTFMGSIYSVAKKSNRSLLTSLAAGVVNVSLNLILIPRIGIMAAVISTVAAYITVFILRCIDSRKLLPFELKPVKIIINTVILAAMTFAARLTGWQYAAVEIPCFAVIFVINYKCMLKMARKILPKKLWKFIPLINKI